MPETENRPSQESLHDEHDFIMNLGSAKVGRDGFSAGRLTNRERDDGGPSSQMEDQQCREPTERTPTQPNPPSRKSHDVLDPRRPRDSSRLSAERASKAKKMSTRSNSHKEERLRHYQDKQWEVRDIDRTSVQEGRLFGG